MTEPWIAFPPEVHSAMLNYGAGVGPMLISATQNGELSAQYAEAASEVEELLGVVASDGWQGQAAEAFVAAYMPFLAWLIQASADCVEMAAQQHVVIEAYTAAVELMPTQVELAANQIKLAVLVATNFFGINTIPIAINEAEYVEMWVRAATTMATYSTVSRSALSAMPHTSPPPLILKSDELLPDTGEDSDEDGHNHGGHSHGGHARMIDNFFAEILRGVSAGRIVWDPVNGTLNGLDYDDYVYPGHAIWWLARGLEFFQDGEQFGELLFTNPTGAFQFLLYVVVVDLPTHIAQIATWLGQYPQLLSAALTGVIAHLGAITGLAGLSGLSAIPSAAIPAVVPELTPVAAAPPMLAVAGVGPAVAASGMLPASAPAPAAAAGATAAGPTPPATGFGGFPPYLVGGGGPGIGFGSGQSAHAKAAASDSAAAESAAQASARAQARAARRGRSAAKARGHRDEFVTMDMGFDAAAPAPEHQPGARASDCGAGPIGFAGTVRKEAVVKAAGLTTLAGDDFGGGPTMPMMPGTWTHDQGVFDEHR